MSAVTRGPVKPERGEEPGPGGSARGHEAPMMSAELRIVRRLSARDAVFPEHGVLVFDPRWTK
jgi:hypothetical protein